MAVSDRDRWNEKYAAKSPITATPPDDWLVAQATGIVPAKALELACGLGQNSIWLAQQGWDVDAVDISSVGLGAAHQVARQGGISQVNWIEADLDDFTPGPEGYNLVVVFRFLDRRRLPGLIESALRRGGILIYETFSRAQISRPDNHLKNAALTLAPGELPTLFPGLIVRSSEEIDLPDRSVARLVAQKPA